MLLKRLAFGEKWLKKQGKMTFKGLGHWSQPKCTFVDGDLLAIPPFM